MLSPHSRLWFLTLLIHRLTPNGVKLKYFLFIMPVFVLSAGALSLLIAQGKESIGRRNPGTRQKKYRS
ncbi:MAG: hypothetical protein Q8K75_12255, partial [Chlamydiales bacterium]|nr:hypothetical protein [Chlamydiales bacterium]